MLIYLPNLKSFEYLKKYLPHFQDEEEHSDLKGTYNSVFFAYANVLATTDKDVKGSNLSIAVVRSHHKEKPSYEQFALLRNVNKNKDEKDFVSTQSIASPFIQRFLYIGKNGKISVRAHADFLEFSNTLKTSRLIINEKEVHVNIKEIASQLILAVQTFHSYGLVHRDIKPENFLVIIDDKCNVSIELADLDTIANIENKSLTCIGTPSFFPRKFEKILKKLPPKWTYSKRLEFQELHDLYKKSDKMYLDCYALATTLKELAPLVDDKDYESFESLIYSLKRSNNLQKTVMDNDFFGETPEKRLAYFDAVHAKFTQIKRNIFYDTYYQSRLNYYPELEDTFWLLPKYLKDIYAIAENLENQIAFFNDDHFSKDIDIHLSIANKTKKLIQLINDSLISLFSNDEQKLMKSLKQDAKHILRIINFSLALSIKNVVSDTVENFEKISTGWSFLQKFRYSGSELQYAKELLQEMNDYSHYISPKQLLERLSEYLQHAPGPWDSTSFKTLLKNNIIKHGLELPTDYPEPYMAKSM